MNAEALRHDIEALRRDIEAMQKELNDLTSQGSQLTDQNILKLSTKLDALIVEYLKQQN